MPKLQDLIKQMEKNLPKEEKLDLGLARIDILLSMDQAEFGFDDYTPKQMQARLEKKYGKALVANVLKSLEQKAQVLEGLNSFALERLKQAENKRRTKRVGQS